MWKWEKDESEMIHLVGGGGIELGFSQDFNVYPFGLRIHILALFLCLFLWIFC